jgi:flavin-dependent dehydrogenase
MALVVPRDRFDDFLVQRAVHAGVDFRPSVKVSAITHLKGGVVLSTSEGAIEAAAVVVAAGAISGIMGASLSACRTLCSIMARYADFPHNPSEMEMIYSSRLLPYYAWLFPEPGGCVNIGLIAGGRCSGTALHATFDYILDRYFVSRLGRSQQLGRRVGAPIKCGGTIGRVVDGCVVLAGESAGLVNCATAEGIAYALESGELAATAVANAISGMRFNKVAVAWYQRAIERRFACSLRVSSLFRGFVASAAFPAAAEIGTLPLFQRLSAFALEKV